MKKFVFKTGMMAAGISILAALPCVAQSAIVPSPMPRGPIQLEKKRQLISLRFVAPDVMAFWLDPKNERLDARFGSAAAEQTLGNRLNFPLPAGVERVIGSTTFGGLLVTGTDEGVAKLREIVAVLDRPARPVEIEARIITIQYTAHLSGSWSYVVTRGLQKTPARILLDSDAEKELGKWILRRQARVESTRRLLMDEGATELLDFGPLACLARQPSWSRDFSSAMPVLSLSANLATSINSRPLPEPSLTFALPHLQISPTIEEDGRVTFTLENFEQSKDMELVKSFRTRASSGETLAIVLPNSPPGNFAFLLLVARTRAQAAPIIRFQPSTSTP